MSKTKTPKTKKTKAERLESVGVSHDNRDALLKRFGFMPMSILNIGRGALHRSMFHYGKEKGIANLREHKIKVGRDDRGFWDRMKEKRDEGVVGFAPSRSSGMSVMPAELVDFFIKYYATPGAVYLDPFMGQRVYRCKLLK